MSNYYSIVKGTVSQMQTFDTQTDFLHNRLAGLPSIGLALLGNAAGAASQLSLSDSEGLSGQFFSCLVGNIPVEGAFSKAFFTDGDFVEAIGEMQSDGRFFAYAVRRPVDHRLWLYPWATRGTIALIKISIKYLHWVALAMLMFTELQELSSWWRRGFVLNFNTFFGFSMSTIVGPLIACLVIGLATFFTLGGNRKVANKIFATLGYPKPKHIDMSREEFFFLLQNAKKRRFYCDTKTPQYLQMRKGAFWVVQYRYAPKIPDYITVIDGDNNTLSNATALLQNEENNKTSDATGIANE